MYFKRKLKKQQLKQVNRRKYAQRKKIDKARAAESWWWRWGDGRKGLYSDLVKFMLPLIPKTGNNNETDSKNNNKLCYSVINMTKATLHKHTYIHFYLFYYVKGNNKFGSNKVLAKLQNNQ